tara:strand:+ start:274 stop:1191 length:918 start_codon:yes stop_codon:yes gene_type:complete
MINKNKNLIIGLILCFVVISCLIINCKYRENYSNNFNKGICRKKPEITPANLVRKEIPECGDIVNFQTTDEEVIDEVKELVFEGLLETPPTDFCNNNESIDFNLNKIKEGADIDSLDISENDKIFLKKIVSESFIEKLKNPIKFECIKNEISFICKKLSEKNVDKKELIKDLFDSKCFITALTLSIIELNVITPSTDPVKKILEEKIIKTLSSAVAKDANTIIELSKGITEINTKKDNNLFKEKEPSPVLLNKLIVETEKPKNIEKREKILNAKFVDNTPVIRSNLELSVEGQKILDTCKSENLI